MAWTARDDDGKKEFFDSPEELERKVQQLAEWVRESRHFFVFTVSEGGREGGREGEAEDYLFHTLSLPGSWYQHLRWQ